MTEDHALSVLEVRKDDWAETRVVDAPVPADLEEHEVLFRVDGLALAR